MTLAPPTLADLSEKEWQRQVVELARMLGWKHVYHTHDSRKSARGFPDLVMLRERQVALELKAERGRLSEAQKSWILALLAAGVETYVVRPRDLDALAKVLAYRGDPFATVPRTSWPLPLVWAEALREQARKECAA